MVRVAVQLNVVLVTVPEQSVPWAELKVIVPVGAVLSVLAGAMVAVRTSVPPVATVVLATAAVRVVETCDACGVSKVRYAAFSEWLRKIAIAPIFLPRCRLCKRRCGLSRER